MPYFAFSPEGLALVAAMHCGGLTPTCNLGSHTCVCVASGAETCDGLDNDCNGTIDDGFNVGAACSVGVGVCQANGTLQCNLMGTASCSAVPGMPCDCAIGDWPGCQRW